MGPGVGVGVGKGRDGTGCGVALGVPVASPARLALVALAVWVDAACVVRLGPGCDLVYKIEQQHHRRVRDVHL